MSKKNLDLTDKLVHELDLTTCIHDVIEKQVVASPGSTAIVFGNQEYTYQELNHHANQLANYLQQLGLKPDMLVGICTSRSFDMVVGILGILKAGGAFVPLDPSYPSERLSYILQDSGAQFLVSQGDLLDVFSHDNMQVICLDKDWSEISKQPKVSPQRTSLAANLAYVIYTSGSTGKPKGVMITHANLCNFVQIACSALDVRQKDIYLHTASIAYALSIRQLMVPLAYGATIVLASADQTRDPLLLFDLIKERRVSLMDMVPSFWRTCIQRLSDLPHDELKNLLDNSLRRIVSVGEPLYSDIPQAWRFKLGHQAALVNIFGQTETTGVVATYPILDELRELSGIVPIGRSVSQTKIYILDSNLKPVKDGETGELCISNPCLARGYLNRPDLTAEKFISNPFDDKWSDRLYRTGDLARFRSDGSIEFLGRGDHQVKIRGQRLELGEVETVLREHPAVSDCVVIVSGEKPEEKYLVAYIVLASGKNLVNTELRKYMRKTVPDYMVPSEYVFLDALPLTPNGKVNRLVLTDLSKSSTITEDSLDKERSLDAAVQFQNETERILAEIWQDLLNIENVGRHDNFFELGGHSLMAVRMFARIERELGIRLPLTSLFNATSVAQLTAVIAQHDREEDHWSPVVPIHIGGTNPPFFGIHGREGGVLFWRDMVSHLPDDQPFYAIQAQGVDGVMPALMRVEDMASLYLSEIRKIQPHGPYYLGGYSMGGEIAFEIGQQLYKQGEKVGLLVMFDTHNPERPTRLTDSEIKLLSGTSSGLAGVSRIIKLSRQKLNWHLQKVSGYNASEKIKYVFYEVFHRLQIYLIFSTANIYLSLNKRLPDFLLLHYLRESHSQALYRYIPKSYPGAITLFRATQSLEKRLLNPSLDWKTLAGGGLDVYLFDATHNLVDAIYSKEVAERLNLCLQEAFRGTERSDK